MTNSKIAAVVLGAGKGTRMKSDLPKVMMPICGKPMIKHILETLDGMNTDKIVVVTAPDGDLVRKEVAPHESVIQEQQLGTGDAVLASAKAMEGFDGDVLVVFGDSPLTQSMSLNKLPNLPQTRRGRTFATMTSENFLEGYARPMRAECARARATRRHIKGNGMTLRCGGSLKREDEQRGRVLIWQNGHMCRGRNENSRMKNARNGNGGQLCDAKKRTESGKRLYYKKCRRGAKNPLTAKKSGDSIKAI